MSWHSHNLVYKDSSGRLLNEQLVPLPVPHIVIKTASDLASPTAAMLADLNAVYQLDVAPYTRYQSTGTTLVAAGGGSAVIVVDNLASSSSTAALSANQGRVLNNAVALLPAGGDVTSVAYSAGRVTQYTLAGVVHNVTYPDSTHVVDTAGAVVRTATLDGSGNIISIVKTP